MEQYKPQFMGKVIPADDPSKIAVFCARQYDAFNRVYEACKAQAANIADMKGIDSGSSDTTSLSVKLTTDAETMKQIQDATAKDTSISVRGDVITAKSEDSENEKEK